MSSPRLCRSPVCSLTVCFLLGVFHEARRENGGRGASCGDQLSAPFPLPPPCLPLTALSPRTLVHADFPSVMPLPSFSRSRTRAYRSHSRTHFTLSLSTVLERGEGGAFAVHRPRQNGENGCDPGEPFLVAFHSLCSHYQCSSFLSLFSFFPFPDSIVSFRS